MAHVREPVGIGRQAMTRLKAAIPLFDTNHNGVLEPEERAAMLRFLAARIRPERMQ